MNLYRFFRSLNYFLFLCIAVVSGYLMLLPVLPEVSFRVVSAYESWRGVEEEIPVVEVGGVLPMASIREVVEVSTDDSAEVVSEQVVREAEDLESPPVPIDDFGISIPSIRLDDSRGLTSFDENDLWKGIWHKKRSGDPINGGNMVITAHRFLYTGYQDTFYHLPKVEPEEEIRLSWGGEEYLYEVTETFEVTADQVEIEERTEEHMLTLYTCTPLWTSQKRFVVRALPKI